MPMRGFEEEFDDIPDYIIKITERIWEGRGIGLIRRWYAPDCLVHTTLGPSKGSEAMVAGTYHTLNALPDRRLLAEDVIWSGDEKAGYLSSHRSICPGYHRGDGNLGPATGRQVNVRAIADCVCIENRIVEEWLIRDSAGLARQIGIDPAELGQRWAAEDHAAGKGAWQLENARRLREQKMLMEPVHQDDESAAFVRGTHQSIWSGDLNVIFSNYHPAVSVHCPGFVTAYGHEQLSSFFIGYLSAFPDATFVVEHSIARNDPGRPARVSTRWWFTGTHTGHGRFGPPSGATVLVLGITHSHVVDGRIREEWVLVDEVAVHKQIALHRLGGADKAAA